MPLIPENPSELTRIDLPEAGEYVMVKPRLSRGDEIRVQKAVMTNAVAIAGDPRARIDAPTAIEAAEFATLEVAIRAWSFPEPVTPANIRLLDGASIEAIKEALESLYPDPRTDDERKNSSGATPPSPSTVEAYSLASSNGSL